jgi:mRNA interferase MazF
MGKAGGLRNMVGHVYVPERGDIVWLDFDPQTGREQAGRRPALALSESRYHRITSRGLFCPITSKVKGYPFEVPIVAGNISGVVLADHIKNLDWKARRAEASGFKADTDTLRTVLSHLSILMGM